MKVHAWRGMRLTKWLGGIGGALWIGSWYVMYREVTHWHHVKPSLGFNYDIGPNAHPGQALILLYIVCVAAPLLVLTTLVKGIIDTRRRAR